MIIKQPTSRVYDPSFRNFFKFRNVISSNLTRDCSQAITAPLNTLI